MKIKIDKNTDKFKYLKDNYFNNLFKIVENIDKNTEGIFLINDLSTDCVLDDYKRIYDNYKNIENIKKLKHNEIWDFVIKNSLLLQLNNYRYILLYPDPEFLDINAIKKNEKINIENYLTLYTSYNMID